MSWSMDLEGTVRFLPSSKASRVQRSDDPDSIEACKLRRYCGTQ